MMTANSQHGVVLSYHEYLSREIEKGLQNLNNPALSAMAAIRMEAHLELLRCKMPVAVAHELANKHWELPSLLQRCTQPNLSRLADEVIMDLMSRKAEGMEARNLPEAAAVLGTGGLVLDAGGLI